MQDGVNLTTKDKDLNVVFGKDLYEPPGEQAMCSVKYIYKDLNDIRRSYITLGFHLNEFEQCGFYQEFGYDTMAEMCEANFGLDKSAYSRCINVWREFCLKQNSCPTMFLEEKYKDYSYSQLVELLPMDEKHRKLVKPDMSVREIRELKRKCLIPAAKIAQVIEHVMDAPGTDFTRDEVLAEFMERGREWEYYGGDGLAFSFCPGKLAVQSSVTGASEFYTFASVLSKYEEVYHWKEVATSQPEELPEKVKYESFASSGFIDDLLKNAEQFVESAGLAVYDKSKSGKRLTFWGDDGNLYTVQYSVVKGKKESQP